MLDDDFTGNGAFHIAALLNGKIDNNAAWPHRRDLRIADEARRRPSRYQRRGDDDILLGDMRRYEGSLRGLVFVGHLSRVTARALALNALHILNEDGFRAEGLNLFLRRRATVGRRHLRAKTPGSRNRSEEHTSELQSLMRISYAVFCLKKKKYKITK